MLVDGGVVDNIPLAPMKAIKSGPNLVVHFGVNPVEPYNVKYESIPGRRQLMIRMLNPFARGSLPRVPGPISVLRRCFGIHQNPDLLPIESLDLVLAPPPFPGSSFTRPACGARASRARSDLCEQIGCNRFTSCALRCIRCELASVSHLM
jgi:NTE family protein